MTQPNDLADCTAHELLALYRSGRASPVEATRAVLARIDRLNPVLNAFCVVDPESALRSAAASEARWQRGAPEGDLDGVPLSIKDLILAKGWPTLRGSRTVDPSVHRSLYWSASRITRGMDTGFPIMAAWATLGFTVTGTNFLLAGSCSK